jgi:hypothetical protein
VTVTSPIFMKLTLAGQVCVKGSYNKSCEYGTTGSVTDAKSQIWFPHKVFSYTHTYLYISYIHINIHAYTCTYIHIQGVPGGKDQTSGECSLGQTIPI